MGVGGRGIVWSEGSVGGEGLRDLWGGGEREGCSKILLKLHLRNPCKNTVVALIFGYFYLNFFMMTCTRST